MYQVPPEHHDQSTATSLLRDLGVLLMLGLMLIQIIMHMAFVLDSIGNFVVFGSSIPLILIPTLEVISLPLLAQRYAKCKRGGRAGKGALSVFVALALVTGLTVFIVFFVMSPGDSF